MNPSEHAPYYAPYVARVPLGVDPADALVAEGAAWAAWLGGLSEAQAATRYAPGKWSVKEVVGHVSDAERVFAYRVLRIARGDTTPLPSFDETAYAAASGADARPLADLAAEFAAVRAATVVLVRSLSPEALARWGTASGHPVTARAMLAILFGHSLHHRAVLAERYGLG